MTPRSHLLRRSAPSRVSLETLESRLLLSVTPTLDLSGLQIDANHAHNSRMIVQFQPGATPVALPGTTLGATYDLVPNLYEINLEQGTPLDQALASYRALPEVALAQVDNLITSSWVPNDGRLADQWYLRNQGQSGGTVGADVGAVTAWDVTTGSRRMAVAVIDSGIDYTHPDLYLNVWINQREIPASRRANLLDLDNDGTITFRDLNDARNQGPGKITDLNANGFIDAGDLLKTMVVSTAGVDTGSGGWADSISQDGDRYVDDLVGWNFYANNNNPFDDYGHGTHVSGTIGAVGNNREGVAGLNWQVQLVPLKIFNESGAGSILSAIAALDYAVAKGIRISNNSWNDSSSNTLAYQAIARARAAGHIFVAAAGNQGRNTDGSLVYPAGYDLDNIVSVGATDRKDNLASFSNYGTASVDIVAPGVDIYNTNPNKSYGLRSGTSMATPQVTATIALVWTLRPEWTHQQVISWIKSTATRLPSLQGKVGSGRLNVSAAVRVPPRGSLLPASLQPASTSTSTTSSTLAPASIPKPSLILAEAMNWQFHLEAEIAGLLGEDDRD
ncbi:MAG: S8 family peptidase [Gemmataceae bacterium]